MGSERRPGDGLFIKSGGRTPEILVLEIADSIHSMNEKMGAKEASGELEQGATERRSWLSVA
jgi:hypothetical protein